MGHLGHDEATEAGGREFSLCGRVVKGVRHLGHDEAMEAGGHQFEPQPGHYSRMSFWSNQATGTVFSSKCALLSSKF